jgi:hypothetical protein
MRLQLWILFFALVPSLPVRTLADDLGSYQQQCTAAVKAHDDRATIAACQNAALDDARHAAKAAGEGRYALELQEAADILDYSRSEGSTGNLAMAQKDAVQALDLFNEIANVSNKDSTVSQAQAGANEADALISSLASAH